MLQASITNVSSIFFTYVASVYIWMLYMLHTYVVSVLFRCYVCFTMVFMCFCKCFICLQTFVASVAFWCFKSRSGVISPSLPSTASPRCLLLLLEPTGHPNQRRRRAPPPPPSRYWWSLRRRGPRVGARNKVQVRAFVRTSRRTAETSMVARHRQLTNVVQ
jgi:hypothetical protein